MLGVEVTILVVDDHAVVLGFLRTLLERAGFTVLAASSADEAMEFERQGLPIDLLLSDVVMQGTTGWVLAAALTVLRPALPVILISGHPAEIDHRRHWRFVEKPFTPGVILLAIQEMLNQA
jgi:DNA-binding NtrC family response regulator